MKNTILLTESEKERILGFHKNAIKESRLNEQDNNLYLTGLGFDTRKGTKREKDYSSNLKNYPNCIRQIGNPQLMPMGHFQSSYAIKGTGNLVGFYFYPFPYSENPDGDGSDEDPLVQLKDGKPMVYNPKKASYSGKKFDKYSCLNNNTQVKIGEVTYNLYKENEILSPETVSNQSKPTVVNYSPRITSVQTTLGLTTPSGKLDQETLNKLAEKLKS